MRPLIGLLFISLSLINLGCTGNVRDESTNGPTPRDHAVGFFSTIHNLVRGTELSISHLLHGIRDGTDSIIYDAKKDFYETYQK